MVYVLIADMKSYITYRPSHIDTDRERTVTADVILTPEVLGVDVYAVIMP